MVKVKMSLCLVKPHDLKECEDLKGGGGLKPRQFYHPILEHSQPM